VDVSELEVRGWTKVSGVTSRDELLQLAFSLGRPVRSPTGELIKQLVPTESDHAKPATLSAMHGRGAFPLHTDTAFWPKPCRYLLFRATGDTRRPTTLGSFQQLLSSLGEEFLALAEKSVWIASTPRRSHYCSMRLRFEQHRGWRYDPQCMIPANEAARRVESRIKDVLPSLEIEVVRWEEGAAVIVCNWTMLHGRGPMPVNEKRRILERVYVE
jgi:alpha-ketoglutarate-dependent taurine dioxygenase